MALSTATTTTTAASAKTTQKTKRLVNQVIALAQKQMKKSSNPLKATQMQKYLKSNMPMYGLQRQERSIVESLIYNFIDDIESSSLELKAISTTKDGDGDDDTLDTEAASTTTTTRRPKRGRRGTTKQSNDRTFPTNEFYRYCIQQFWDLPMREEKYLAIDIAMKYRKQFCTINNLDIYESMLRSDYMWWDLCDPIATNLIGHITRTDFCRIENTLRRWINDDDDNNNMWIRRTAILAQLKSKSHTNQDMLFEFCRLRMHEKEFFIRKAIGWLLREYSKTNPNAVIDFLKEEKPNLSGLSYREGSKHLIKQGHRM